MNRQRIRATIGVMTAGAMLVPLLMALLIAPLPVAAAVQPGRTIEVFLGTNLVGLSGYPENTQVTVQVVRNGVVVGQRVATTDGDGSLELNHVGGDDCFDPPVSPDIVAGDTLRTITEGDGPGVVDEAVVVDIALNFPSVTDVAAGTITVTGHARSTAAAPIAPGDVLEVRLNKGSTDVWDSNGRRDLREDVGGSLQADGTFTFTFNVSQQDAQDWQDSPGELSLEWSAPITEGAGNTPAIFVADEGEGGSLPGCPPLGEYALTESVPPVVNAANVGMGLVLSGVARDATSATITLDDSNTATAPLVQTAVLSAETGGQTFSATFLAADVAGLMDGTLMATMAYTLDGATGPSTGGGLTVLKDVVAPTVAADLPDGLYNMPKAVTLTASESATIRYVLNGASDPTPTFGTIYSGPVNISANGTTVLKFIAVDPAGNPSNLVTRSYQLDTVVPTVAANPPGGAYRSSQSVSLAASEAAQIFYTLDGSTPTTASTSFSGTPIAIAAGSTTVLKFIAVDTAGNSSPVVTETYRFELVLAVTVSGTGSVTPIGNTAHGFGSTATLTATAGSGHVFTGWAVDGVFVGWSSPLTITMDGDHTVAATFAARPRFPDVAAGHPYAEAIAQLAARGIIRGYENGDFGPNDTTLRAQMAALIARAMGWDAEDHLNPFPDRGAVDANLWRNVGTLAFYNVARGYPDGTYQPTQDVLHAQTISFISRAMVARGFWQQQPVDPALFGGALNGSGHEADAATYRHYVGGIPGAGAAWPAWDQPATRGWFAQALWAALDSHFGVDRVP